jgi:acyl-ACP thioesterase
VFEVVPAPAEGRRFEANAQVRLGDSSPGGRARLDALARLVQDVSDDDARAAGFRGLTWVVRRAVVKVHAFPIYLEPLALRTWCSGTGAAWAERRVSLRGRDGGHVETATLWVHIDPGTMRPARLPDRFLEVFAPSAAGRAVHSRQLLDRATGDLLGARWPLRFTDFDVLDHVNNAVYWEPVEQELALRRRLRAPLTAVLEHGDAIDRDDTVRWVVQDRDDGFDGWLLGVDGRQFAAVRVVGGTSPG